LARVRPGWVLSCALILCALIATVSSQQPRFYSDDPISREPASRDASGVKPWDIGLLYELSYNLFVTAEYKPSNTRALDINTIDEVPDSSWFTNRIGSTEVSAPQLARGPEIGPPPAPEKWVIIREKSAGANPGFTAKDANGETWFLGFDPPSNPRGATAAVVVDFPDCRQQFSNIHNACERRSCACHGSGVNFTKILTSMP